MGYSRGGQRINKPKNAKDGWQPLEAERGKEEFSESLWRVPGPANTFWPPYCKIMNACCFKSSSVVLYYCSWLTSGSNSCSGFHQNMTVGYNCMASSRRLLCGSYQWGESGEQSGTQWFTSLTQVLPDFSQWKTHTFPKGAPVGVETLAYRELT